MLMTLMTLTMRPEPKLIPGMMLPARLPRGFMLGEHMVDGWLRDSGMAAIYRAHRLCDGRRVAVKLQLPSMAHDPSLGERFEREAEVLWRVRGSAHVVELLDVGVLDDGRRYLVLEWVDGEDLEELLDFLRDEDRQLPVIRACKIARDVARGLAALHEHGVVHLDLKPANVMIGRREDDSDHVVLVDFGIAADLRELAVLDDDPLGEALMGTSGYMSPQRARGRAPSPACDVYALGVLLFEALSGGCVPPDGWSPDTLPRVDALRHGVPRTLSELVCTCMSVEAGHRPASAKAVAATLEAIIGALEAGSSKSAWRQLLTGPGGTEVAPVFRAARRRGNRVGAEAGLIAVEELPVPEVPEGLEALLRGSAAPAQPGDTLPGIPIDAGDTEVMLRLPPVLEDDDDNEPTFVLAPVQPEIPDDDGEPEPTFVLAPVQAATPVYELPPPEPFGEPLTDVRPLAWTKAPTPDLEWLERRPRWWLPWMIAAGMLAATAGVVAWLARGAGNETMVADAAATDPSTPEPLPIVSESDEPDAAGEPAQPVDFSLPARTEQAPREEVVERAGSIIASKPAPRASAVDSRERAPRAHATAVSESVCTEARAQASTAKRARAWGSVLKATSKRRCWSSDELRMARSRLRVTAYAELGELERCVEEGAGSRDREITVRTALCRKKLAGG